MFVGIAALGLAVVAAGLPDGAMPWLPDAVSEAGPAPSRSVQGVFRVEPHFQNPTEQAKPFVPSATRWPAGGTEKLTLNTGVTRARTLPVWVERSAAGPAADLEVKVLDHAKAEKAAVPGVLLTVAPTATELRIGLDHTGFGQAYGGSFGDRLRLVEYPTCLLNHPDKAECHRPTPLTGGNRDGSVTGLLAPSAQSRLLAAAPTNGGDGGKEGTYSATDLKASGSWTAGGNAGSFTYGYPIAVPAASSSLVPEVSLSYDSGSLDGQTATSQAQASWAGDGWSTPRSFVEQSFTSCANDPEGTASPVLSGDLCYNGPILTLSLNGTSTPLVWDAGLSTWKPKSDNGSVVNHVVNSNNGSATYNTDYWTVTTRNGTVYSFGRNQLPGFTAGQTPTNSVDSVPVYSSHANDPCYSSSGFAASVCTMANRWNLDYVVDVHGNAMSYNYVQDRNYYGQNNGTTNVSYVRDSHLDHIDYGFTDGGAYGTIADKVVFATGDRCLANCQPLNATTKANWADVPFDLICNQGATCTATSPAYFSTVRLTSISTRQWNPATSQHVTVDSYALDETMPSGTGQPATLWLASITHTGSGTLGGGSTTPITLPPVQFTTIPLQNRTDPTNQSGLLRYRIRTVKTETGSVISPTYDLANPCAVPVTVNPAANTSSCYPVTWTPSGYTQPTLDWFNKYVVTKVTVSDPTGGAPDLVTNYEYPGGAAWHHDDNELTQPKYRSYGEFRGYGKVRVLTGDIGNNKQALSETTYYRGMSGNVKDSLNADHTDAEELAGRELETSAFLGNGGMLDHSSITSYWVSNPTATRSRTGLPALTATIVAPALIFSRQAVTGSGATTWRQNATDISHDTTTGLEKFRYTHTTPVDNRYDKCTRTEYAAANTAKNLVGLVSETETDTVACGGYTAGVSASVPPANLNTLVAPGTVNRPDQVAEASRTWYDDPTFATAFPQSNPPAKGDPTLNARAADWATGQFSFPSKVKKVYDTRGRVTSSFDGNGNETATTYTTDAVGLTTAVSTKNAVGHISSTVVEPQRGQNTKVTDPNGVFTTLQYDPLGRSTAVWLSSRLTTANPNQKFSYAVSNSGITATTSQKMNNGLSAYQTSTQIYDGLFRVRQTQSNSSAAAGGRLVTDTFYDSRGWKKSQNAAWYDSSAGPGIGLVSATDLGKQVPNQDTYTYDGLGRVVTDVSGKNGAPISTTTTVYNGDRTTVIPPAGGTTRTTVSDPLGRDLEVREYLTNPTLNTPADTFTGVFSITGGTTNTVRYGYDGHGRQNTTTDDQNNVWTSRYDLLGRLTGSTDPDAGTSTGLTYDANGNLLQSTDARNVTVSTTYDALNRKTGRYAAATAAQSSTNRTAAWVYDNSDNAAVGMHFPLGKLTSSTSYKNGSAYTRQQTDFAIWGSSLSEKITIPAGEGALTNTYTFKHTYTSGVGLPFRDIYEAAGGLPAENVTHGYTGVLDMPSTLSGAAEYANNTSYDAYGRVDQVKFGSTGIGKLTNVYDEHTGRVLNQVVTRTAMAPTDFIDNQNYVYDAAGNVLQQSGAHNGSSTQAETQCFRYDGLRRLTAAWTGTDNCVATPATGSSGTVGSGLSGAYWTTWAIDNLGRRTQQVQHGLGGAADVNTTYTYNTGQPHTLASTSSTGGGTTSYGYDNAGNTNTRNAGQGSQILSWDEVGRLSGVTGSTAGNSNYVYDADGNLLLQKDPGTTTLYLPGQQLALDTTSGTVTGNRYYGLPSGVTAVRTGSTYSFVIGDDQHATGSLKLDSAIQNPTWRQFTPYGGQRGAAVTWLDNHGFLDKTTSAATGLTHIGARDYDPNLGRFLSVDPEVYHDDPQTLANYIYANNSPFTFSDPTGRSWWKTALIITAIVVVAVVVVAAIVVAGPVVAAMAATAAAESAAAGAATAAATAGATAALGAAEAGAGVGMAAAMGAAGAAGSLGVSAGTAIAAGGVGILAGTELGVGLAYGGEALAFGGELTTAATGADRCALGGCTAPPRPSSGCGTGRNSFSPDTPVLMADGTSKPIKDIQEGEQVKAADPETGETAGKAVTKLHKNQDTELTNLTVVNAHGETATIETTQHHPFWDETSRTWVFAGDLQPGHKLHTDDGTVETVAEVQNFNGSKDMRNLTVADIHTYYVVAGGRAILVHNTNVDDCGIVDIVLDRGKYPESAKHQDEAVAAGHPEVLTLNRPGAKVNRRLSLRGIDTQAGLDRDEYPPAVSGEGGSGASVKHIPFSDNRGSGSTIGRQLRPYPDGTRYRIKYRNIEDD
ncbi:polymorphic toxin-type HINT domain-containing protein [Longispora sp. K20-0274]|uniref:polymorphic toxin-type HINT domain-containing protein n=1 Tax=Longispora sp. K20-0274 TaxID=3088255 RepID=UPI00399BACD6